MTKKILFIDRDGTILKEPKTDFQIDKLDKFSFLENVIYSLKKIYDELDFIFVLVSNQDGLGTDSFPKKDFEPYQNLMLDILKSQGIKFYDIKIDPSLPSDNSKNRKPEIGMLTEYIKSPKYDIKNSLVIGDRETDIQLAENIGCRAIRVSENGYPSLMKKYKNLSFETTSWKEVYFYLKKHTIRKYKVQRKTKETDIKIVINLDGQGKTKINTGLKFFDHMLEQIGKHSGIDLEIYTKGDLEVDEHHTIEDTALALGEAFNNALGNKKGISRYGFYLPMDDALSKVALDFSGRPWLVWDVSFKREKIGDVATEMFFHFFKSFTDSAKCNLNIKCEGNNEHHKIESIFKAFAKSIEMAIAKKQNNIGKIPSTKGVL